jgi:hypothetical protein
MKVKADNALLQVGRSRLDRIGLVWKEIGSQKKTGCDMVCYVVETNGLSRTEKLGLRCIEEAVCVWETVKSSHDLRSICFGR